MERLTERYDDGEAFCDKFSVVDDVGVNETILKGELIDKLADYEDAEEQGVLLRLPCKLGDAVYIIVEKSRVYEMEVMGVYPFGAFYEDDEKEISRIYNLYLDGNVYYKHCTFYDIGKTVFLTKEEAEQALADIKGV